MGHPGQAFAPSFRPAPPVLHRPARQSGSSPSAACRGRAYIRNGTPQGRPLQAPLNRADRTNRASSPPTRCPRSGRSPPSDAPETRSGAATFWPRQSSRTATCRLFCSAGRSCRVSHPTTSRWAAMTRRSNTSGSSGQDGGERLARSPGCAKPHPGRRSRSAEAGCTDDRHHRRTPGGAQERDCPVCSQHNGLRDSSGDVETRHALPQFVLAHLRDGRPQGSPLQSVSNYPPESARPVGDGLVPSRIEFMHGVGAGDAGSPRPPSRSTETLCCPWFRLRRSTGAAGFPIDH